jgi:alpha-tubulin suppressor-like RCC1 family protein
MASFVNVSYSPALIAPLISYSWGRNQNGQLGLGHTEDSLVPQVVEAFQASLLTQLLRLSLNCALGYCMVCLEDVL